jgi:hypothetical protein
VCILTIGVGSQLIPLVQLDPAVVVGVVEREGGRAAAGTRDQKGSTDVVVRSPAVSCRKAAALANQHLCVGVSMRDGIKIR